MNQRIANKLAAFEAKMNAVKPDSLPKSDVRHNAYTHGLTAQALLLSDEERPIYNAMSEDFRQRFQPGDGFEQQLLQKIIDTNWRLNICASVESALYAPAAFDRWERPDDTPEQKYLRARARTFEHNLNSFALLARYEGGLARRFHTMLKELETAISKREAQQEARRKEQQTQPGTLEPAIGSANVRLKELVMSASASSQPQQKAPLTANSESFRQTPADASIVSASASPKRSPNDGRRTSGR